ncbi:hypothetical protein D3Z62_13660 [Lachnospiraceae bacterium]|nr:hypothetical protein [Lachnospiraceae bacterium]
MIVFPHAHSIKSIATVKTANARIFFIVILLPSLHFSAQSFLMWEYLRSPSIYNRQQKPKLLLKEHIRKNILSAKEIQPVHGKQGCHHS